MISRILLALACLWTLAAFTPEERQRAITACAGSIKAAKDQGRKIPDAAVANRVSICTCIADGMAADTVMTQADKLVIIQIYEMGARGQFDGARDLQRSVGKEAGPSMRRITRGCTKDYMKPRS